ncbi:tRNA pseudouridine(55) synthase TruB [Ectothiorhodospiraceae bacterium 2226]|nr:tRNA pseudouridine(55) synthase TruB [Ectothiorhodospiraceae bacterium 2226]
MARRYTRGRPVNGILLLDKPAGLTSNAALQEVKRLFNARKAGHTGNLDPLATGLLPVCLGEATKMSAFLLDADKRYQGVCKLGERTNTGDAEGEVIERRPVPELTEAQVREVLARFTGTIEQIPPMHSAIKRQGQPLYKLAHQGIEVERDPRTVHIHVLELVRLEGDELEIDVHCSKGTYIRTLAEDIGAALGCGAHLASLRRSMVGPFDIADAVGLDELAELAEQGSAAMDARLLPLDTALADWPALQLTENTSHYLRQGQPVLIPRAPTRGWVRLFGPTQRFLGVGQILDDGRVAPKRLVSVA